ncbi:hypothetical protein IPG36_00540 [bacterium]|nr:MAG: hypothetical protein IPG36_00540 [bacterium]
MLVVLALGFVVVSTLFNGWVLQVMWNWFMPEIFPALPSLSLAEAFGLSLVVAAMMTADSSDDDEDVVDWLIRLVIWGFGRGLILLIVGFFRSRSHCLSSFTVLRHHCPRRSMCFKGGITIF